jgi:hypothetical protein
MPRGFPARYEIRVRTVLSPALRNCLAPCGRWTALHRHTITRFTVPDARELDDLYHALMAHNVDVVGIRPIRPAAHP